MNMPAGLRRVATVAALAAMLGGCSTVTGWFTGSDNAPKPTPLQAIQNNVTPKVRWDVSLGGSADYAFTPALMGDVVWAAGRDGQVVGVDVNTGRQVGRVDTRLPLSGGIGAKNGALYVATTEGELVSLDENGKIRWRARLTSQALEAPQSDGQRVLVRTNDGRLSAFYADSGKSLWTFQRPQPTLTVRNYGSTTLVGGEAVLLGMPGGRLAVIGANMGDLLWEASVSTPRGASELERMADVASRPVFDRGQVCAVAFQGKLTCFDARSGTPMWSRDVGSSQGLTVDAVNLYVTGDDGTVWAFDRATGRSVWTQNKLKYRKVSAPAMLDRFVLVLDGEGIAHLLSNESGEFVGRQAVAGGKTQTQPQSLGDRVLVQTQGGRVLALSL